MKNSLLFAALVAVMFTAACAKVYYSPESYSRAQTHKIIAIAPPKVSIEARKKVDAEALKEQQKTESGNIHREMYSWMVRRQAQGRIKVDIQDVETTTAKLAREGYYDGTILTPEEMCQVLGVDALITSNYALSKPMSEGGAIALGVLTGVWGSTNNTKVNIGIFDRGTRKSIWNYDHEVSGGVGSSPAQLVDHLMRNASKRMPYEGKK